MRSLLAATRQARLRTPALTACARDSSNLARIKEVRMDLRLGWQEQVQRKLTPQPSPQVRERSGAPMHEVKSALVATAWDIGAPLRSGLCRACADTFVASRRCTRGAALAWPLGSVEEGVALLLLEAQSPGVDTRCAAGGACRSRGAHRRRQLGDRCRVGGAQLRNRLRGSQPQVPGERACRSSGVSLSSHSSDHRR